MPALALEGVTLRRGKRQVCTGLTLALEPGQRGLVLGSNGSGKSTIALATCGLLRPSAGRIERPAKIGYCTQEPAFPASRTCVAYLRELAALGGASRADSAGQAERALARFGIDPRHPISTLSRGWRQRLNLARAWLGEPPLVVLDEPQTALDPAGMAELAAILDELDTTALVLAPPGAGCDDLAPVVHRLAEGTS